MSSNITSYPLQDNFETNLAQSWNWAVWTIYVNDTPTFTFPSNTKTYIVVDPGKTAMQVARISAYNATLKTMTVDSISVNKWAWLAYTQQSHAVGAVVRISDNYQFREDIKTSLNNTVWTNTDDTDMGKFADEAARDAYFTAPVDGNSAYVTSLWLRTDYISWAWVNRATGSVSNASTTVAGKVEVPTWAEDTAWAVTGWTGASLASTPWGTAKVIQSWSRLYAWASATGNDTYAVTMTPALTAYTTWMQILFKTDVANTWACSININGLWAKSIKNIAGNDPATGDIKAGQMVSLVYNWTNMVYDTNSIALATNSQAITWTDTTTAITPYQLANYPWTIVAWTTITAWSGSWVAWITNTTPQLKRSWTIVRSGTYTVTFTMHLSWTTWWSNANGRVYKNWVAYGTSQIMASATPTSYSEDLAFTAWDTVEFWLWYWWIWEQTILDSCSVKYSLSWWWTFSIT